MTVRGKETGKQMLPPGTPAPMPFITKTINAFPILSPSLRQESIFFPVAVSDPVSYGITLQVYSGLISNMATTHLANYQSTPSFQNKLEESAACTGLCMKEWSRGIQILTDTYSSLFAADSKKSRNTDSVLKQS